AGPFGVVNETNSTVIGTNLVVPPYNIGPGATPNYEANLAAKTAAPNTCPTGAKPTPLIAASS
ncbi:MAG: hypothetical protein QOG28_6759, partial [Trebonia sp.]|nr:hypothetical protein [Trebonia sp.]